MDILSRLPIITLFNCRCVCKTWLHLISDPHFAKLQLQRSPPCFIIQTEIPGGHIVSRQLQLTQLTGQDTKTRVGVEKLKFNDLDELHLLFTYRLKLINSCNGLLCLRLDYSIDDDVLVFNPILGEFISIPFIEDDNYYYRDRNFGFGFCDSTNEYKVVQTFNIRVKKGNFKVVGYYQQAAIYEVEIYQKAEIYTIGKGKGKWKSLGIPPCLISRDLPVNASLNGCIHWIDSVKADKLSHVYSFDFSTEKFKRMSLPCVLDPIEEKSDVYVYIKLGVWKDCLYMSMYSVHEQCELWVMKEYGVKESWTKMLVVETISRNRRSYYIGWEPLAELDNENMLMLCDGDAIVCYNTKTNKFRNAKIARKLDGKPSIISHTPTFISLKDIAKEEEVELTRCRRQLEHEKEGADRSFAELMR